MGMFKNALKGLGNTIPVKAIEFTKLPLRHDGSPITLHIRVTNPSNSNSDDNYPVYIQYGSYTVQYTDPSGA